MTHTQQLQRGYSSETTPHPAVWTLQTPGIELANPVIRAWIQTILTGQTDDTYTVELVVSELATNALTHSASGVDDGTIRVELHVTENDVTVRVYDDGPAVDKPVDVDRCGGLGLTIIGALATECGEYTSCDGRHCAWARIDHSREPA